MGKLVLGFVGPVHPKLSCKVGARLAGTKMKK